jgi:hypothetical protein
MSCGVITSDCDWRSWSLAVSAIGKVPSLPVVVIGQVARRHGRMKLARLLHVKRNGTANGFPQRSFAPNG